MGYRNKEDQSAAAKRHYEKNRANIKRRAYEFKIMAKARNRAFVSKYLKGNRCVDCGISDIRVLEFDHVRGDKTKNISDMVRDANSIAKIEEEISKCDVRCANCHRIKTHETLWS